MAQSPFSVALLSCLPSTAFLRVESNVTLKSTKMQHHHQYHQVPCGVALSLGPKVDKKKIVGVVGRQEIEKPTV